MVMYRHEVATLGRPVQRKETYTCSKCGRVVDAGPDHPGAIPSQAEGGSGKEGRREPHPMHAMHFIGNFGCFAAVQYPAVAVADSQVVLPTHEGTISDGSVVDQYGDPELMANFAEHYLASHRAVMPSGRVPNSVVETMPALHLLIVGVELVLKADLMRSSKDPGKQHSLEDLYKALEKCHRRQAEKRFHRCEPNTRLEAAGVTPPGLFDVLRIYDRSYGSASKVYLDTRYYAESTTKLHESSGAQGANLVKGNTPYPIFLPYIAESLIAAFRYFDGPERLKRRGGQVAQKARAPVENNHGDWGLVPASLGLVAVQVRQHDWMDADGAEQPAFKLWRGTRTAGYSTSWMYGGSILLFYRAGDDAPSDLETSVGGINCRIWHRRRLGMHSRDLYRLADALETPTEWGVWRA